MGAKIGRTLAPGLRQYVTLPQTMSVVVLLILGATSPVWAQQGDGKTVFFNLIHVMMVCG